jgi:uncharacterized Zn-finger protein
MTHEPKIPACTRQQYQVTAADLPLCCPMPDMRLWDAHPRVYLPIEETGHVVCPYCDAEYFLKDFAPKELNGDE